MVYLNVTGSKIMKTFFLKTPSKFFTPVWAETKPFELLEDRGYQVGDRIVRLEFHESANQFTGRLADAYTSYKIDSNELGLEKGFCVLGLTKVKLLDVYKLKPSSFNYQLLYKEGLQHLRTELEEAYAECFSNLDEGLGSELEVYLNSDYNQDAA